MARKPRPFAKGRRVDEGEDGDDQSPAAPSRYCSANGCPLPGSISHDTRPTKHSLWYCGFHHAAAPRTYDRITLRIRSRPAALQALDRSERRPIEHHGPIAGLEQAEGENVWQFLARVRAELRQQALHGVEAEVREQDQQADGGLVPFGDLVPGME